MYGGIPTNKSSGVFNHYLTLHHPDFCNPFTILSNPGNYASDGGADIAAAPLPGGSGEQLSGPGPSNVAHSSHQRATRVLDDSEFHDAPYVPPRSEPLTYPAVDPRVASVYHSANHIIQRVTPYSCEGATSPSDSVDWNTSSSSSTSSQIPHGYAPQTPQPPLVTTYTEQYPAFDEHQPSLLRHDQQPPNTSTPYYQTSPQGYSTSFLAPEIYDGVGPPVMQYPSTSAQTSSPSSLPSTNRPSGIMSTFPVLPSPVTESNCSHFPDAGSYLRKQLGLSPDESVTLCSLPEPPTGVKPSTPLPMLIKLAIYGSPRKQLTLQEIYTELEKRFEWFRTHKNDKAWKNSIRHNLSLNKVFKNVPRPITEPGKGSYWQLDVSGGEGYKRLRKRRAKNKTIASEEEEEAVSEMDDDRSSSLDPFQQAGPSRSSATPIEEASIDPELRSEGHVVGEGRTRSATRRTAGGSPYPQHSPRYQQGQLPVVSEQDASVSGQPLHRFGQPSFNLPTFALRPVPAFPSPSSFADMVSSPTTMSAPMPRPQSEGNAQRSSPESSTGSFRTLSDARARSQFE